MKSIGKRAEQHAVSVRHLVYHSHRILYAHICRESAHCPVNSCKVMTIVVISSYPY